MNTSHAKWLRQAAEEIRDAGHAGWGNTCADAADAFDWQAAHIAEIDAYRTETGATIHALQRGIERLNAREAQGTAVIKAQRERIAELEKQLAGANQTIALFMGPDGEQHIDRFADAARSLMVNEQ